MRLVDADEVKKTLTGWDTDPTDEEIEYTIDHLPTVDAAPVVHGRWKWDTEDIYECSNCGEKSHVKEVMGQPAWDFCPNCGAKMDGDSYG